MTTRWTSTTGTQPHTRECGEDSAAPPGLLTDRGCWRRRDRTGHFTAIVWKATTGVGCGKAWCTNMPIGSTIWTGYFYVCNYTPPGEDPRPPLRTNSIDFLQHQHLEAKRIIPAHAAGNMIGAFRENVLPVLPNAKKKQQG